VWTKDGSQLKRTVVDDMVMHGITVDEMKEFVDWIFVNKPPTRWNLEMMRFFYKDWINIKAKGDKHRFADAREQQASSEITMAARRLEEKQFLDFVTEGYFDDCLTKGCYALALDWRARYADVTILSEIEERYKSFAPHDLKRLGEWRAEIKSADKRGAVNYKRLFVVEMARQKELTVGETLAYFYRDELKPLFNEEELVCKGLDGMVKIV
jgi:hypothetical protein